MSVAAVILAWLAPLVTFLLLALPFFRWSRTDVGRIAVAGPAVSFIASLGLLIMRVTGHLPGAALHVTLWNWIPAPEIPIPFTFHIDALTLVMMLVVTGVGTLIHIYSIGYMEHDEGFRRYFAYLNLFILMMLTLVMADALPLLFIGWEGVGLCSYLLIGFWFERPSAARAGRKAFVVNRIGDAGFLIGIFLMARLAGTWRWEGLSQWAGQLSGPPPLLSIALLALFVGATGKSAQIPLYVWLPDAMEGPTPVSALIHAATMVTAGVYMVVRLHDLYHLVPAVGLVIAVVGLVTAFYAGLVAAAQTEMKKILAFSTVSQLGYMFIAAGVGAYMAAIFHLVTHAFFKALLFLLTGNVMHATGDEQDIYRLGRLRETMPTTFKLFAIGALTLAGLPPLAAFFSKEAILSGAYIRAPWLWFVAWMAAGITAFYSLRLFIVPFFHDRENPREPHEAPPLMLWPLYVLGFFSVFGGIFGPVLAKVVPGVEAGHGSVPEWGLMAASLGILVLGAGAAFWIYERQWATWQTKLQRFEGLRRVLERQIGWNEFYDRVFVRPLFWLAETLVFRFFDATLIDGIVDGSGRLVRYLGERLRPVHSGEIRRYAYAILLGAVLLLMYFFILIHGVT